MSITPGFTLEEIREYVHEYQNLPHGTKTRWLKEQPFSRHQLWRWQDAVFGGDLDRGMIPRESSGMTPDAKSRREISHQQRSIPKEQHDAELAALQARIHELEGTNEALGKAIGLLHKLNEQEPDTLPTTGRESSSRPRTTS